MALTYQKVLNVISQTPDNRKDFEVNNLLAWFRKKSDLFRSLKTEPLFDIIKHLQLETKIRDDIIIRQGDQGDCMYILLRGQVTVYTLDRENSDIEDRTDCTETESVCTRLATFVYYFDEEDMYGNDDGLSPKDIQDMIDASLRAGRQVNVRSALGEDVCQLDVPDLKDAAAGFAGAGAAFGEVAMLSDDGVRTASVIADDNSDVIVVDRELYNRSVRAVLQKEFEDKSNFIAGSPYFQNWSPKYKRQLAMALVRETVPYENVLVRQGEPVKGIYFVLSGEVKLLTDPEQHKNQYPKFGTLPEVPRSDGNGSDVVSDLLKQMSVKGHRPEKPDLPSYRRRGTGRTVLELCLLGMNESVGDVEVLLDLETYMQTAVCTQRTEVLLLERRHLERLLVKRNPRSIDTMKVSLELKLSSRISDHIARQVPLLSVLSTQVQDYMENREKALATRAKANDKHGGKQSKRSSDTSNSHTGRRGSYINQHSQGASLQRVRKREQTKIKRSGPSLATTAASVAAFQDAHAKARSRSNSRSGDEARVDRLKPTVGEGGSSQVEPALNTVEERMRDWRNKDKDPQSRLSVPTNSKYQSSSRRGSLKTTPDLQSPLGLKTTAQGSRSPTESGVKNISGRHSSL